MKLKNIINEFEESFGDLLEIKIKNTNISDWNKIITFFKSEKYKFIIEVLDIKNEVELDFDKIEQKLFDLDEFDSIIKIFIDDIQFNSHLISIDEIDFNFDPRQVTDEVNFDKLLLFITKLSNITNKNSLVCHENFEEIPIFYFNIDKNEFVYKS